MKRNSDPCAMLRTLGCCFAALFLWQIHVATSLAETRFGNIQPLLNPIVDEDGNSIPRTEVDTLIWSKTEDPNFQVLSPEGDPLTLGDWLGVGGTGQISRTPEGTDVNLEITGLVPNGVYTAWGFVFQDPPFNFGEIANFPDRVAAGAVGPNDGSESRLQADANGNATFATTIPPGPLSLSGEASSFILDGNSSYGIAAIYHPDGMTYGPIQGPMHVGAFTVGFAIPEPSSIALGLMVAGFGCATVRRLRRIRQPTLS